MLQEIGMILMLYGMVFIVKSIIKMGLENEKSNGNSSTR